MSIQTLASRRSAQRGYDYYLGNKVLSCAKVGPDEWEGLVSGSGDQPYPVKINTARVRQSSCSCAFAAGRKVVCKHMVALFFTAFPEEADAYRADNERKQREARERARETARLRRAHHRRVKDYVNSLSAAALREKLTLALLVLQGEEEWDPQIENDLCWVDEDDVWRWPEEDDLDWEDEDWEDCV